ncbi:hypothetical protein L596_030222 [Steinernema carpocapsae]|uniref:Nuclear receptor domain-containing protein n=1 Tax=Steinernema carpocapsae TaxID=34508 RepID=A0A4U5LS39_STECR|nr:hypothetical protein L596_030222 [Steinernema carpocapsae]
MALSQPSRARILEDDVCLPDLKPVEVKKRQLLRPERCLICESGTTCNHYNIPSCNKCKTFFRRAVLSSLSYDCPFDGECVIRHGLPFCKACRFRKCIKVGMRPDNISKIKSHQKESKQLKLQMLITQWPKHPDYLIFNEKLASQGIKQWAYMDAILAIELYKTLPVFYRLDPPDQENLVKSTLLQMCSFHPAYDAYFRKYTVDVVHPDGYHPFAKGDFKDNPLAISVRRGILPSCVKNHINKEKIVLLKMIIMLNSAAPNLSERAQELIATERIKYVKALIKAVQLDSSSTSWISRYQNVYNLIDQNLSVTNKMTQLFFSYYVPLISRDDGMAKLWLQLFFGRS